MHWTEQYLSPLTRNTNVLKALRRLLTDYLEIIPFGLLPHTEVRDPSTNLPVLVGLDESGLKAIEKIYDASLLRIENLEKKAFNLLSYITASFTIIALLYSLFSDYSLKVWLVLPIGTLLFTFFVSFRCLSVKSIYQVFVGDLYRFESGGIPITKGSELHLNYLKSAIHNEAKANETADMLRAARMFLITGMMFLFIVVGAMMAKGADPKLPREEEVHLRAITENLYKIDSTLAKIASSAKNDAQMQRIDSLAEQVARLNSKINKNTIVRNKPLQK